MLDTISAGLSAPTASGVGIAASTLSPKISYEIGQYFKEQASNNQDGKLTTGQEAAHILAHTVLGAAVAATGGNNALSAGIAAGGAEAAAPKLAEYLYGKKSSDLTASEKSTISTILGLAGSSIGATTGNASNIVQGGQSSQNAVENNDFTLPFPVNTERMQRIESIVVDGKKQGLSDKEIQDAVAKESRGRDPQGEAYMKALIDGTVIIGSITPVGSGYRVYQGGKWVTYTAKDIAGNPMLREALKNAAANGAVSGGMSAAAGDDAHGIAANTIFGAAAGGLGNLSRSVDTVKGQMILGGIANIGAQEAANKSRTLNGKDASDINWLNAGAAAITGGAVKNIEKSLNISGSNPVVIIPSMTINAITSGNDKNKPALENEKENKNGKK